MRQAAPGWSGVLTMNFASATASLSTMGTILGVMVALALVESVIPLHARDEWGRRHLVPNLALTFLTFATNLVFNTLLLVALVWLQSKGWGLFNSLPPSPSPAPSWPSTWHGT